MIFNYLAGLPSFALYFGTAVAMLCAFTFVYTKITPHDEFKLLREDNPAAALALLGAMSGFSLPLASSIANSVVFIDFVLWGLIAAIVQIVTFFLGRMVVGSLSEKIVEGKIAAGAWMGTMSLMIGLLNAASMTY